MKIKDVTQYLEAIAPPSYQEGYDNAGLIVGSLEWSLKRTLLCLDSTEEVIDEAIKTNCNLVIAHHPIVFKGLKRFNGKSYVERAVMKAIKNDIAIYAIHTNLDNMYSNGVNSMIAKRLGLKKTKILAPKKDLKKLFAFVPVELTAKVRNALFETGAGTIHKKTNVSYTSIGAGTTVDKGVAKAKMEVLFPSPIQHSIVRTLEAIVPKKLLEYDIVSTENTLSTVGSGMIGELPKAMSEKDFLAYLKKKMKVSCIKHTALFKKSIQKVAVCGGAGGFLLKQAIRQQADIFITADYKYHEFFDADGKIIIADIGHYESEQFTMDLLSGLLKQKFRNFAPRITKVNTNPVQYYF